MTSLSSVSSVQHNIYNCFGNVISSMFDEDIVQINDKINSENNSDKIDTTPSQEHIYKLLLKSFFKYVPESTSEDIDLQTLT